MMSAIGALLLADAERLVRTASVAARHVVEALLGTEVAFGARIPARRARTPDRSDGRRAAPPAGRQPAAARAPGGGHRVQDPYSLRCMPQVHGAVRDTLGYLQGVLDIESIRPPTTRSSSPGRAGAGGRHGHGAGTVISGGNFHGEPVALALDFATLALAELGEISERRVALLLDPR